jgi:hypothetical protein
MRTLIDSLDSRFGDIDRRQRLLLSEVTQDQLFWSPVSMNDSMIVLSVGGGVLRSAAMVEQAFLGITRRLWDDPFEWTLPEKLSTTSAITEYLDEVATTRSQGLKFLKSDTDLAQQLPAPEKLKPILEVLVDAIGRSENYLGRGDAVFRLIKGKD